MVTASQQRSCGSVYDRPHTYQVHLPLGTSQRHPLFLWVVDLELPMPSDLGLPGSGLWTEVWGVCRRPEHGVIPSAHSPHSLCCSSLSALEDPALSFTEVSKPFSRIHQSVRSGVLERSTSLSFSFPFPGTVAFENGPQRHRVVV